MYSGMNYSSDLNDLWILQIKLAKVVKFQDMTIMGCGHYSDSFVRKLAVTYKNTTGKAWISLRNEDAKSYKVKVIFVCLNKTNSHWPFCCIYSSQRCMRARKYHTISLRCLPLQIYNIGFFEVYEYLRSCWDVFLKRTTAYPPD